MKLTGKRKIILFSSIFFVVFSTFFIFFWTNTGCACGKGNSLEERWGEFKYYLNNN